MLSPFFRRDAQDYGVYYQKMTQDALKMILRNTCLLLLDASLSAVIIKRYFWKAFAKLMTTSAPSSTSSDTAASTDTGAPELKQNILGHLEGKGGPLSESTKPSSSYWKHTQTSVGLGTRTANQTYF